MAQRTVLITGTSTGIGAACVARQATAGWKVYAGVRAPADGERLVAAVDGDVTPIMLDVTHQEDIVKALARIEAETGMLHGLVNNAGIGVGGPVELVTDEDWRRQFEVNFFSVVTLTREAMPLVSKADGRFVHIGSLAGRIALPGLAPYAATKHALEAFNWALRQELSRNTKLSSSLIEPGEIETAIWDKADQAVREFDEALDETGTRGRYGHLLDGQRGFVEEGRTKGVDPDHVAQAVEHALTSSRPKARYLVGLDAKAGALVARLPDRVVERLIDLNHRRLERAGRGLS